MASIAEDLLYTTTRLEGKCSGGQSVGTGFYFLHNQRLFLVTNKHVVRGVTDGSFIVPRAKIKSENKTPILGQGIRISFSEANFIGHPDESVDVAAMNVSGVFTELEAKGDFIYWKNIQESNAPTKEIVDKFIGPVEEIIFVGYPSGIWDTKNILPIVRQGATATPYYVDFEGKKQFLIDASVFPGSSGSPVFFYYAGSHADKEGNLYAGSRVHFLGIIASVFFRNERGELLAEEIPTQQKLYSEVRQMIDLGVVFKDTTIVETVDNYVAVVNAHNKPLEPTR
jgi:hypothetical protein